MTLEEIREILFHTLDTLDKLYVDRSSHEDVFRQKREAHDLEVSKERSLVQKDARIAAQEKELAETKGAKRLINVYLLETFL